MKNFLAEIAVLFSFPQHLVLLLARVVLAFGFIQPAAMKINDVEGTTQFFKSLSVPFSGFFAYLVPSLEALGIALLIFGLFTRFISIFLAIIMIVAIVLVHWSNGFSVAHNGFEIPLYYLTFSLLLISFGAGKYSLDSLLFEEEYHD